MKNTLKYLAMSSILAGSIALAPNFAGAEDKAAPLTAIPAHLNTQVNVKLKGYVFGIKMIRADYKAGFSDTEYTTLAHLKTSGLAALLKKFKITASTTGKIISGDLRPVQHIQQNHDKKHRRVEMNYGAGAVDISIVPRLGSLGTPAASPKQAFESDDAMSALLNIMMRGYKTADAPCSGSVPVFDSKQHYNLRMEPAGTKYIKQRGYKGDSIRCAVYYEPVSGFDPEDLPSTEEASTPILIYLAKFEDAGLYIPVRMTYKISGFKAVIKAREISIVKR